MHGQETLQVGTDPRNLVSIFICADAPRFSAPIVVSADATLCPCCGKPLPPSERCHYEELGQ